MDGDPFDILVRGADGELYYLTYQDLQQYRLSDEEQKELAAKVQIHEESVVSINDVSKPAGNAPAPTGGFLMTSGRLKDHTISAGFLMTYVNVGFLMNARKGKK